MTDQEISGVVADAIEPEVIETDDTEQTGQETDEDTRDWQSEARDMGWVPETEFRGPEGKWKDAKAFVEDGENVLPIVRSQNKRLREEIAKERDDFAKRLAAIERTSKTAFERQKQAHETAMSNLAKEMRRAAAEGDIEKYDELSVQRDQLDKDAPKDDAPANETPEQASQRAQQEWVSRNDWYRTDFDLAKTAEDYSQWLARNNPDMSLTDNLAATEKHIKEKYPEKFGAPAPKKTAANGHAAVDGGSDAPPSHNTQGKLSAKLPPEARAAGQRFVSDGTFKTIEEYAEVYFNG